MATSGTFVVEGFDLDHVFSSLRRWMVFSVAVVLSVASLTNSGAAQVKSGAAGVLLRATLVQSLSVSAQADGMLANAFLSTDVRSALPVTFTTKWVRGPASITMALVYENFEDRIEDGDPFAVVSSSDTDAQASSDASLRKATNEVSVATWEMQFPETSKKKVLTIRAQAI